VDILDEFNHETLIMIDDNYFEDMPLETLLRGIVCLYLFLTYFQPKNEVVASLMRLSSVLLIVVTVSETNTETSDSCNLSVAKTLVLPAVIDCCRMCRAAEHGHFNHICQVILMCIPM